MVEGEARHLSSSQVTQRCVRTGRTWKRWWGWPSHQLGARTSSGSGTNQGHIPAGRLNSADVMLTTDGGSGGGM